MPPSEHVWSADPYARSSDINTNPQYGARRPVPDPWGVPPGQYADLRGSAFDPSSRHHSQGSIGGARPEDAHYDQGASTRSLASSNDGMSYTTPNSYSNYQYNYQYPSSAGPASSSGSLSGQAMASSYSYSMPPPPPPQAPRFGLSFLQQPTAPRACGNGEKDRRTVDPPPILSIDPLDEGVSLHTIRMYLARNPGVVTCSMLDAATDLPVARVGSDRRRLLGTLTSPVHSLENTRLLTPWVACFPDLSVRTPGLYKLRFSLVFMGAHGPGTRLPVVANAISDVFECYTAKDFPGMQASSPMVQELRSFGIDAPSKRGRIGTLAEEQERQARQAGSYSGSRR